MATNVRVNDALHDPLQGVLHENTYIDLDPPIQVGELPGPPFNEGNVYIQNKSSLGRIQYEDGRITCTTSGYTRKQVWKLSRVAESVEEWELKNEIEGHVLTIGENGNLQCEDNGTDNQNWKFRKVNCGEYQVEVEGQALYVEENGDLGLKITEVDSIYSQLWTFIPADDYPFVRIQSFQTGGLLTTEEYGDVHAASCKFTENQIWLMIPKFYDRPSEVFYLQNYQTGLKLASVIDVKADRPERIVAVHDNVNEEQLWEIIGMGRYQDMEFMNCYTKLTLTLRSNSNIGLGDRYNHSWVLMLHTLKPKPLFVKLKKGPKEMTDPFLVCEGINVWSIVCINDDEFILKEPRHGFMLAYDGKVCFLSQELNRENQIWIFDQVDVGESRFRHRIRNKKHDFHKLFYIENAPFGLDGLAARFVYRVCRSNENITESITPSAPWSTRTLEQHIGSGSVNKSKFISTTADELHWRQRVFYDVDDVDGEGKPKRQKPRRSVKIDLDLVRSDENLARWCINLGNKEVRDSFLRGSTNKSWATHTKEVIFMDPIPRAMYTIIDPENLEEPPPPKVKKGKKGKKGSDDDIDELGERLGHANLNE